MLFSSVTEVVLRLENRSALHFEAFINTRLQRSIYLMEGSFFSFIYLKF